MIRSTKKEVKEKIRAYIMGRMEFCDYTADEPETDAAKVLLCRDIFRSEYGYNIRRMGEHRAFQEWLSGVPGVLTVDFSYYGVRQILRAWLDQTEEESARFDDVKAWEYFLHLVTREFFAMVDKAEREKTKKGE